MQNSWWTKLEQMDADQKRFVGFDADGKHLLVGPRDVEKRICW